MFTLVFVISLFTGLCGAVYFTIKTFPIDLDVDRTAPRREARPERQDFRS